MKETFSPAALALFDTAARYQLIHGAVLVGIGLLAMVKPSFWTHLAAVLLAGGIAVFSGSLYALAFGAPRSFGMVAPLGGSALIAGWLSLGVAAFARSAKAQSR